MTVDGKSGSQSDLKKGMVMLVNATLTHNYGTGEAPQRRANQLVYEDTVGGRSVGGPGRLEPRDPGSNGPGQSDNDH